MFPVHITCLSCVDWVVCACHMFKSVWTGLSVHVTCFKSVWTGLSVHVTCFKSVWTGLSVHVTCLNQCGLGCLCMSHV